MDDRSVWALGVIKLSSAALVLSWVLHRLHGDRKQLESLVAFTLLRISRLTCNYNHIHKCKECEPFPRSFRTT